MKQTQTMMFDSSTPMARRADPVTSHEAAGRMIDSGRLAEHERVALALVRLHPGRTGSELDKLASADKRQISKRLAGLAKKQLVRRGAGEEIRTCEVNGNRCVTWWATNG